MGLCCYYEYRNDKINQEGDQKNPKVTGNMRIFLHFFNLILSFKNDVLD